MRLRKKWWARPYMEETGLFITDAYAHKGKWNEVFGNDNEIHLELGCGRGDFVSKTAAKNPHINYIAIDLKDEVMVYAVKKIEELGLKNVRIMPLNIMLIDGVFGESEVSRIYLNFSTPWPKERHNKRRLSHGKFLTEYKKFLAPSSEIWMKTDQKGFFIDSAYYFKENGFRIDYLTYDLHDSIYNEENVMTEYETKFTNLGDKINFMIGKLK